MTGVAKGTILRLLTEVGKACQEYQERIICNIPAKRVQVDEIWSFCYAKEKNATPAMWERAGYAGDVWTFTAIDADTKLVIGWAAGRRDAGCASAFLQDIASRLSTRIQLTTDGHKMYLTAVPGQISGLRVISRTSIMTYKDARKPLPQIARELNVDAVVEGTVLRSGNQVRITGRSLARIGLAVREITTNAVVHGNRYDLRKKVFVAVSRTHSRLEVTVTDQGGGFDPSSVSDPRSPVALLRPSGRGLYLARTFMDELHVRRGDLCGATVVLVKYLDRFTHRDALR